MRPALPTIALLLLTAACGGASVGPSNTQQSTSPTSATIASTSPAASVASCRDGDLRPRRLGVAGAMGTAYLTISLRHPGAGACTIRGYPSVRAPDPRRDAAVKIRRVPHGLDGRGPHLVTVARRSPAVVTVQWTLGHSCPRRAVASLEVSLPGSTTTFHIRGFGTSSCNPGEGGAPIEVQPIESTSEPQDRTRAQREAATATAWRLAQAFLDEWRTHGCVAASHRYLTRAFWSAGDAGAPEIVGGRVTGAVLWSWKSPEKYVVEMDLDLRFRGDPLAWTNGVNTRFVTVRATSSGTRMELATSP